MNDVNTPLFTRSQINHTTARKRKIAVSWFLFASFLCCSNDLIVKNLVENIHFWQLGFCRFFISLIQLAAYIVSSKNHNIEWKHRGLHCVRGLLLLTATAIWFYGLQYCQLSTATIISFTIPIFTLLLGQWFLKEIVNTNKLLATGLGLVGILIAIEATSFNINVSACLLIIATLFYAILDIINKKLVSDVSSLNMLFHSALWGTLFSVIPAVIFWQPLHLTDIAPLLILGGSANLILYCILKAYALEEATYLAPLHYFEIIFSLSFDWLLLNLYPSNHALLGGFLIIASTSVLLIQTRKNSTH